jgi:membrane-bound serine protease (ClpP class)
MLHKVLVAFALVIFATGGFAQESAEENAAPSATETPESVKAPDTPKTTPDADEAPETDASEEPANEEEPEEEDDPSYVVVCPIEGMIDEAAAVLVKRAVSLASYAEGVVFIIKTPGGRVDSGLQITESILEAGKHCPTIAYIAEGFSATSAGALIAYSCQHIIMTPDATIGAASPVYITPQGSLSAGEKEISFLRTKFRALAERNGHNPDIAMAMVDKDIELRAYEEDGRIVVRTVDPDEMRRAGGRESEAEQAVEKFFDALEDVSPVPLDPIRDVAKEAAREASEGGRKDGDEEEEFEGEMGKLVIAKGKLLTISAGEAEEYGVIPTTCNNLTEVMSFYDLAEYDHHRIEMTWSEKVFRWLVNPTVAGILLLLGVGGLYFEVKTPGFGVPGAIGLICLTLFFGSRAVLGLADWIDIALVGVGISLIALEVVVIPGFGIAGLSGIMCLIAGLVLSFILRDPGFDFIPEYSWDVQRFKDAGYALALTTILFVVFVAALWKILPYTPIYSRLVLQTTQDAAEGYVGTHTIEEQAKAIGLHGKAISLLRPAGRGRFGNRTLPVISRAEYIEAGTPIVITEVEGNRYVIEKVKQKETEEKA